MKKKYIFFNIIIGFLAFLFQYNGVCSIKSINATAMLPLGFAIVLSMFCSELPSFFLGLAFGIITDSLSTTGFGFNAITFSFICFFVSILVHYLFNNNILSCAVLSSVISFLFFGARFLIFYSSVALKDVFSYLIREAMPSAIITAVFSVLFYLLQKVAFKNNDISR